MSIHRDLHIIPQKREHEFDLIKRDCQDLLQLLNGETDVHLLHTQDWLTWVITNINNGTNPEKDPYFKMALTKNMLVLQQVRLWD